MFGVYFNFVRVSLVVIREFLIKFGFMDNINYLNVSCCVYGVFVVVFVNE